MGKIPAVKIVLNRAEGPTSECGEKVFDAGLSCDSRGLWLNAQQQINIWRETAPKELGYDKVDFTVYFDDGTHYAGRIDIKHPSHPSPEEHRLADHIAQEVFFYAGWRSEHGDEKYQRIMERLRRDEPELVEEAQAFWQQYEVPSSWAAKREAH